MAVDGEVSQSTRGSLKSQLTTRNLSIAGGVLIIVGNSFSAVCWNIKVHELLANVGALILVIGVLQWLFDEESRLILISKVIDRLEHHLSRRDSFGRLGVTEILLDSKVLSAPNWSNELVSSRTLVIGIHYSDGIITRMSKAISLRSGKGKTTQVLHSDPEGLARHYLERCLSRPVDLAVKVERLCELIKRFDPPENIVMRPHSRVLRYSFIFSDTSVWVIFLTNSDGYEPEVPAVRIACGTPLYEFFRRDIADLGAEV